MFAFIISAIVFIALITIIGYFVKGVFHLPLAVATTFSVCTYGFGFSSIAVFSGIMGAVFLPLIITLVTAAIAAIIGSKVVSAA